VDWKTSTYLAYLGISVGLTVWVARTLSRNGTVFLVDVFAGEELARSVNRLLVVGFYLVNLGFVTLALRTDAVVADFTGLLEELSRKVGLVLLVVGLLHLLNVLILGQLRRERVAEGRRGLVEPDRWTGPYPAAPPAAAPR
jgi:hypothetical protein